MAGCFSLKLPENISRIHVKTSNDKIKKASSKSLFLIYKQMLYFDIR